ncbi:MAG: hypothetical protein LAT84_05685 [Balneolia bacterium]|nr:hypothetical protein [Balneolia bacterium]
MKYILIIFSLFLIKACSDVTPAQNDKLDKGLNANITLLGDPTVYPPASGLVLSTQDLFSCGGWEFDYSIRTSGEQLTIEILDYIEPEDCIRILAPALSVIRLDDVDLPALMNIRYNGINNMARVELDGIAAKLVPLNFINIDQAFPQAAQ